MAYLDDIIIYSKHKSDHIKHVEKVLKMLQNENLKINLSKSKFMQSNSSILDLLFLKKELNVTQKR